MTRNKAQKRAVRERMAKTGEHYTTARHYLLDLHRTESADDATAASNGSNLTFEKASDAMPAWIEHPGMSDEAILRSTGKTWNEWFAILDQWGAAEQSHREIARFVNESFEIAGWWAQSVTVGYERARGMRRRHEQADGFSVSASKTVPVPVDQLYAAVVDELRRDQWLEPGTLRLRTSQPNRSARFDVVATATLLAVAFVVKGDAKASVQLQEQRLPTVNDVDARRAFWRARLSQLAEFVAKGS